MDKNNIENTNCIILICGGPSSGKTSAAKHLLEKEINFIHMDFDQHLTTIMEEKQIPTKAAINIFINKLPIVASQKSFVMDHWLAYKDEQQVRQILSAYPVFYVWLHCSSEHELKKREKRRKKSGEKRANDMVESSINAQPKLDYNYNLDTNKKSSKLVAELIYKNALKYWKFE